MKPSLNSAFLRLQNAREHIAELKVIESELGKGPGNLTRITGNALSGEIEAKPSTVPIPDKAFCRFSDAISNLRPALDYLVYELAYLDSGSQQEMTQFPICDTIESFNKEVNKGRLKGLSPAHITRIEALQPFKGCQWTGTLRDFSNPDKHITLTSVQRKTQVDIDPIKEIASAEGKPVRVITIAIETFVVLKNGHSAVSTLEHLSEEVDRVLATFAPDFK